MKRVTLNGRVFREYIPHETVMGAIDALAFRMNIDFAGIESPPVFVCVLNGVFMFAAELLQRILFDCEVSFVKLASYNGLSSGGEVAQLAGLSGSLEGRHVIVLEDIVETGGTLDAVDKIVSAHRPKSISYITLFFKPEAYKSRIRLDDHAMEVPSDFIVGFGMDYDGLGRNLNDIYTLDE